MLFLPAGWFHEVTSHSATTKSDANGADGGHLALNFWCHPPDTASFDSPYSSTFWEQEWIAREVAVGGVPAEE